MASKIINFVNHVIVDDVFLDDINPLSYLEKSIAACIGKGIKKFVKEKGIENPFDEIIVNITEETINIRTNMDETFMPDFILICQNCYITNHLKFKEKIIYQNKVIDI
jgi:hypothetical protein